MDVPPLASQPSGADDAGQDSPLEGAPDADGGGADVEADVSDALDDTPDTGLDVADEGESGDCITGDGTPCPGGRCYGGACCRGCWDGTSCHAGDSAALCGKEGATCVACHCASDTCSDGSCAPSSAIRDLAVSTYHSCVVLMDGTLWCWGLNDAGQVSKDESGAAVPYPLRVDDGTGWAMVAAGLSHTCGTLLDRTRICWGANSSGQLGVGDAAPHDQPVAASGGANLVRLGFAFGCELGILRNVRCWGSDTEGQLGSGKTAIPGIPKEISGGGQYEDLTAGRRHACAVRTDRTLWCWGDNMNGELGVGDFLDRDVPTQVGTDSDWVQVVGGGFMSCARKTDGSLYCWGGNLNGQLGQGVLGVGTDENTPQRLGSEVGWENVGAGRSHVCAIRDQGELWCWGKNDGGQLGIGNQETQSMPVRVGQDIGWTRVGGGEYHTCGVRDDALYCWGKDDEGQVGVGTSMELTPMRVCVE